MYALRDSEGKFVARARTRAAAHRSARRARHLGSSVNRAGVIKMGKRVSHLIVGRDDGGSLHGRQHGSMLRPGDIRIGEANSFLNAEKLARSIAREQRRDVAIYDIRHQRWSFIPGPPSAEEIARWASVNRTGGTCRCGAYSFPHASGGGKCGANRAGGAKVSKEAVDFFYKNAGYSYPSGSTPAQQRKARRDAARRLAEAEAEAERRGWRVDWEEDPEGADTLGDVDPSEVSEILVAVLKDENGDVLGSLGGVIFAKGSSVGADRAYGRVVEAELALEAL